MRITTFAILAVFASFPTISIAGVGFLKGEQTSGLNKICYYEGASGSFTKTVSSASVCPPSADDGRGAGSSSFENSPYQSQQSTGTIGFLSGERVSGLNKICYYDSARGTFTKVVGAASLCPQSAKQ